MFSPTGQQTPSLPLRPPVAVPLPGRACGAGRRLREGPTAGHGRLLKMRLREAKETPQCRGKRCKKGPCRQQGQARSWGMRCRRCSIRHSAGAGLPCKNNPLWSQGKVWGGRIIREELFCTDHSPHSPSPSAAQGLGFCFNLCFSLPNLFQLSINYIRFLWGRSVFPMTVTGKWPPCIYLVLWAFPCCSSPSCWGECSWVGREQQMDKVSPLQKHGTGCQVLQVWWIRTHTLLSGLPVVCHNTGMFLWLCFFVNKETAVM